MAYDLTAPDTTQVVPLQRGNPLPFYYQLEERMRAQIESGQLREGESIPPVREICASLDVSRITVERAISDLVSEGLLTKVRGKGVFVAKRKLSEHWFQTTAGFHEEMSARGLHVEARVLDQQLVRAPRRAVETLGVPEGTEMVRVDRVRMVEGEPVSLVSTWIVSSLCPGLLGVDLNAKSLFAVLREKWGLAVAKGRRTIQLTLADARDVRYLGEKKGAPMLLLRGISFLEDDTPLEYFEDRYRGDRSEFDIEVISNGKAGTRLAAHWEPRSDVPGTDQKA